MIEKADIAKGSLYKHFQSKADLLVGYLERLHNQWFEKYEADIAKVADPKANLLAVFDHHIQRQQAREFGGCPFIKANLEAGSSDPRVSAEIQQNKQRLKDFLKQLVINSGHSKLLTDSELAETIYLLIEGGVTAGSVFKQAADLQAAKKIIKKLI